MNAKNEFIRTIGEHIVKCALIELYDHEYALKVGYSIEEYAKFVDSLDLEYDSGYGGQELFGNIWLSDGTWIERYEYDGSERWIYKSCPYIPEQLTS